MKVMAQDRIYEHTPKGCTALLIQKLDWPGNEFGLWLPENSSAVPWANWLGDESLQKWDIQNGLRGQWNYSGQFADITSSFSVDMENDCLWYEHSITNTSDKILSVVNARTCFHLVHAPEFISIYGERYWACLDDEWRTTDTIPREKSIDPRRVGFAKKGSRPERKIEHRTHFPSSVMEEEACHPLIIAESFDRKKSVGIACENMGNLSNNNDSILRCLHSEPTDVNQLKTKKTARFKGVIIFVNGNHEAMLEKYNDLVSKGLVIEMK
jgi:hypothetical protein